MSGILHLTKETSIDVSGGSIMYIIRVNGEDCGYVSNIEEAKAVLDSFAECERERSKRDGYKILREDMSSGLAIRLFEQSLGRLYNGRARCINNVTA